MRLRCSAVIFSPSVAAARAQVTAARAAVAASETQAGPQVAAVRFHPLPVVGVDQCREPVETHVGGARFAAQPAGDGVVEAQPAADQIDPVKTDAGQPLCPQQLCLAFAQPADHVVETGLQFRDFTRPRQRAVGRVELAGGGGLHALAQAEDRLCQHPHRELPGQQQDQRQHAGQHQQRGQAQVNGRHRRSRHGMGVPLSVAANHKNLSNEDQAATARRPCALMVQATPPSTSRMPPKFGLRA